MVFSRTKLYLVLVVLGIQLFQSLAADHQLIPLKATCSSSQFQCGNGGCIEQDAVCDCIKHCGDGADEKNCTDIFAPGIRRFSFAVYCPNGKCISQHEICGGYDDCGDGSDQQNCTGSVPCNHHQFECSNGKCIRPADQCNGFDDCRDGSDEMNCTGKCERFECDNGKCITDYRKCDCNDDCGDGTDEKDCQDLIFHCPNGKCLQKKEVCNCENDCDDGADEENCEGLTFHCSNGTCLTSSKICNCEDDCGDGADEENCENDCRKTKEKDFQFVCPESGKILKKIDLSDGFNDCGDGSDENYCSASSFHCAGGVCRQNSSICENDYGCANRSDGENCIGSCTEFQCPGGGPCIHNNNVCDCIDDCGDGADEMNCKGFYNKTRKLGSSIYIHDAYKYHCNNGKCYTENGVDMWTCRHGSACSDFSDQMECQGKCEGFQCPSGRCIPTFDQCDGINDCGDWTDEKNCPEVACKEKYFKCRSGECVLNYYVCKTDEPPKCRDGSDQENCDWRADLRCGSEHYNSKWDRTPGQCNPFGAYPCCSDKGWCGNSEAHCSCPDCVDYRVCTDGSTYQTNNGASICTCVNGKYECKEKGCIYGSAKILDDGCNYCICGKNGTYEFCTERTCASGEQFNVGDMTNEGSTHPDRLNIPEPVCGVGDLSNATCIPNGLDCSTEALRGAACINNYYCCKGNGCETKTCNYVPWNGENPRAGYCSAGPIPYHNNVGEQQCTNGCNCFVPKASYKGELGDDH